MPGRPRLLLLTDLYWPSQGGQEESVRWVASQFSGDYRVSVAAHGCDSTLTSLAQRTFLLPAHEPYSDPAGIPVHPIVPSVLGRLALLPMALWYAPGVRSLVPRLLYDRLFPFYHTAFAARIDALVQEADIVHCLSTSHLAVCASRLCSRRGVPLIHAPPIHFGGWGDTPGLLRAYTTADVLICPTNAFRGALEERTERIDARVVINPPLPPARPDRMTPPEKLPAGTFVLFLGRRESHKGLSQLVSAFENVGTDAELVVAGPGEPLRDTPSWCHDLGVVSEETKHWLLRKCALLCVPSVNESFGMVYAEAMSCAKPVVAVDVAPVNELVANGESGMLVRPGDIAALGAALKRLLNDPGFRRMAGEAAYRRYERHYSRERIVENLSSIYRSLV